MRRSATGKAPQGEQESLEDLRLRRARYRASRRGTLECCRLLGGFADEQLPQLDPGQLNAFEKLLGRTDPEIENWIFGRRTPPAHLVQIIVMICQKARRAG